jgi:hypothetical protein
MTRPFTRPRAGSRLRMPLAVTAAAVVIAACSSSAGHAGPYGPAPSRAPAGQAGAAGVAVLALRHTAVAGVALPIRPSRLWWAAALMIAGSAFGAVMLCRYVNVGPLGPVPDMYEPTWVSPGKLASAWAEGTATVLAAAGLLLAVSARRHRPMTRAEGRPGRPATSRGPGPK